MQREPDTPRFRLRLPLCLLLELAALFSSAALPNSASHDVYDAWNRLVRRVKPDGKVVDRGYDHAGNRVSKTVTTLVGATFTAYLVDAIPHPQHPLLLPPSRHLGHFILHPSSFCLSPAPLCSPFHSISNACFPRLHPLTSSR
jgi:YD repeat-containing protein